MNKATLSEFVAHLKNKGVAQQTHFAVYIPNFGQELDLAMCEATSLPGVQLMTTELRTSGELTNMPHAPMFNQQPLTFISDGDMNVRKLLEAWYNKVYNVGTRTLGYYKDYTEDVQIYVTDKSGKYIYGCVLRECYIQNIGDSQLSYSDPNVIRIPTTLNYKWWDQINLEASQESSTPVVYKTKSNGFSDGKDTPPQTDIVTDNPPQEWLSDYPQTETAGVSNDTGESGVNIRNQATNVQDFSQSDPNLFQDQVDQTSQLQSDTVQSSANAYTLQSQGEVWQNSSLQSGTQSFIQQAARDQSNFQNNVLNQISDSPGIPSPVSVATNITESALQFQTTFSQANDLLISSSKPPIFNQTIQQFDQIAGYQTSVTNKDIPSMLHSIGSAIGTGGIAISNLKYQIAQDNNASQSTLQQIDTVGRTITQLGQTTNNVAIALNSIINL